MSFSFKSVVPFHTLALISLFVPLLVSCQKNEVRDIPDTDTIVVGKMSGGEDEALKALEVYVWKFDLTVPESHRQFNFLLELREKGKKPRPIDGVGMVNMKTDNGEPMIIMLDPSDYSIYTADQWKISGGMKGRFRSRSVVANPFKGFKVIEPSYDFKLSDGSYVLLSGWKKEVPITERKTGDEDAVLVLKLNSTQSPYGR